MVKKKNLSAKLFQDFKMRQKRGSFEVGDPIEWFHKRRGGWGYQSLVPGTVVKINPKTIRIRVQKNINGTWNEPSGEWVERNVKPEKVRHRRVFV